MAEQTISGWGKQGASFHFFLGSEGQVMLESVCGAYYALPWFWDPSEPLDVARSREAAGNCLGCWAWLTIPKNRLQLEVV